MKHQRATHDTRQHFIQHCTKAPPVDLVAIRKTLNDLWSEILGRATECARCVHLARRPGSEFFVVLHPIRGACRRWGSRWDMLASSFGELLRKAKVSEHNVAVCRDEDVLRFEVTINDACPMQALDAFNDFGSVETGSVTPKTTPTRELCR
jgi:hypothetical protein